LREERRKGKGFVRHSLVLGFDPGRDQGPQGSIGGKDAVVSVAVDAGWGEEGGGIG